MKFVFVRLTSPSLTISMSICVAASDNFFSLWLSCKIIKTIKIINFFNTPKKVSWCHVIIPHCCFLPQPQTHPQVTTDLLSALQICLCFLEIHKNGNYGMSSFLVWLLSFHFITKQYFTVWIDHSWFVHSPDDGCF